jgi:hypothetical protein
MEEMETLEKMAFASSFLFPHKYLPPTRAQCYKKASAVNRYAIKRRIFFGIINFFLTTHLQGSEVGLSQQVSAQFNLCFS